MLEKRLFPNVNHPEPNKPNLVLGTLFFGLFIYGITLPILLAIGFSFKNLSFFSAPLSILLGFVVSKAFKKRLRRFEIWEKGIRIKDGNNRVIKKIGFDKVLTVKAETDYAHKTGTSLYQIHLFYWPKTPATIHLTRDNYADTVDEVFSLLKELGVKNLIMNHKASSYGKKDIIQLEIKWKAIIDQTKKKEPSYKY